MCTKDGKNLTKLLYSETITQVFQSDYPYAESQPIFFTILVQKVSKDDPKVLASINITKYLLNLKIMDLNSRRHNQRVCKCDLGSISLLQWNQMLVSLSQKSKAYIYFIHSAAISSSFQLGKSYVPFWKAPRLLV